MRSEQITVIASNNVSHLVVFWKVGDKVAARPMSDEQKVEEYRVLSGTNCTVSRHFNYGCEIVKFEKPISSRISSEMPKIVEKYKEFLDKSNRMFKEFESKVEDKLADLQKLESISENEEDREKSDDQ